MHKFLLIILVSLSSFSLFAKTVSLDDAQAFAHDFYLFTYNSSHASSLTDVSFVEKFTQRDDENKALYYIFNVENKKGFVLISAEDAMWPILGYAFSGTFDKNHQIPALNFMLDIYEENLVKARTAESREKAIEEAWNQFATGTPKALAFLGPLLSTEWDQDCYYNLYAPSDMSGPCGHAYAGCVATSMSMVMKYHDFPTTGYGTHSYTHPSYGNISANFGATTYAWSSMPNQLISTTPLAQKQAVARLMADCGTSVDMNYSANGSGSNTAFAASSLSEYFRYNYSAVEELASSYNTLEWGQILRDQLDQSLPVIYSGIDNSVGYGHAWALDGYQSSSHFHMNWGWSGSNNGYFLLSSLSTSGYNFTNDQSAVINIKPSGLACSGTTQYKTKNGKIEDGSGPANYADNQNCSYLISPVSGNLVVLTFEAFNTEAGQDIVSVYDGTSSSGTLLGSYSGSSIPPVLIANSGNMFITFTSNGSTNASGWKARWSQTPPIYCTNTKFLTAITGTFDDGSGNSPYMNNSQCKWLLKPLGASTVSVIFHEFDLHSSDHLYVYNGPNTSTQLLGSYTGNILPPNIQSTGNSMLLYFVSGSSLVAQGWKVSYFKDNLSIGNTEDDNPVKLYPNPAQNGLNVEMEGLNQYQIFNAQGQLVRSAQATPPQNQVYSIDIQGLKSGYYFIQLIGKQGLSSRSFIKE